VVNNWFFSVRASVIFGSVTSTTVRHDNDTFTTLNHRISRLLQRRRQLSQTLVVITASVRERTRTMGGDNGFPSAPGKSHEASEFYGSDKRV